MSAPENSPLRCEDVRPLLSAYADRETMAEETAWVKEHLRGCAACTSYLAFIEAANHTLRAAPEYHPSPDLFARIARATYARPTFGQRVSAWLRPAPIRIALGSAVALGIVAAVVLPIAGRLHVQDSDHQATSPVAATAPSDKTAVKAVAKNTPAATKPSASSRPVTSPITPPVTVTKPVEIAQAKPVITPSVPSAAVGDDRAAKALAANAERAARGRETARAAHNEALTPRHTESPIHSVLNVSTKPVIAKGTAPQNHPAQPVPDQRHAVEVAIANMHPATHRFLATVLMDRHMTTERLVSPTLPETERVSSEIAANAVRPETSRPETGVAARSGGVVEAVTPDLPVKRGFHLPADVGRGLDSFTLPLDRKQIASKSNGKGNIVSAPMGN